MSRKRRIMTKARIDEISAVDKPAQEPAMVVLFKAHKPEADPEEYDPTDMEGAPCEDCKQADCECEESPKAEPTKKDDGPAVGQVGDSDEIATKVPGQRTKKPRDLSVYGKREFSAKEREHAADSGAAMPDGSFPIKNASDLHNAMALVGHAKNPDAAKAHIKRRAQALGLSDQLTDTYKNSASGDAGNSKKEPMTNDLQKRLERAEKLAEMNDAQKAFHKSLEGEAADQFLGLTGEQRDEVVRKAGDQNPVIYKSEAGETFRKNDDPRLVAMAKRLDQESQLRKAAEQATKLERLQKRAQTELKHLPGEDVVKAALLGAVESIQDAGVRGKVEDLLKAQDLGLSKAMERQGVNGEQPKDTETSMAQLTKMAGEIQKAEPKLTKEQAFDKALRTPEGGKLYEAHLAGR